MKIVITAVPQQSPVTGQMAPSQPQFKYGGQNRNGGLQLGIAQWDPTLSYKDPFQLKSSIPEDEDGNIEVEKHEIIAGDYDGDGQIETLDADAPSHAEGGKKILAPKNAFVFSDTKKMELGGEVLELFGKPKDTKKKYTPAQLAKQYDINKYKAIIDDPNSDNLQKKTAEQMVQNYTKKLEELAIVSESLRGFPNGVPELVPQQEQQEQQLGQSQTAIGKMGGMFRFNKTNNKNHKMSLGGDPLALINGTNSSDENISNNMMNGIYSGNTTSYNPQPIPDDHFDFTQNYQQKQDLTQDDMLNQGFAKWRPKDQVSVNPVAQNPRYTSNPVPGNIRNQIDTGSVPYGTRSTDDNALAHAYMQLATVKHHPAYVAPMKYQGADYVMPDNSREIANYQSMANSELNTNATFADGARLRSIGSSIEGQLGNRVGDSAYKLRAEQIQQSNLGNRENRDVSNKQAEYNAGRLTELYKQGIINEDAYTKAVNHGFTNIDRVAAQRQQNAVTTQMANWGNIDSGHYVDPKSGKVRFMPSYGSASGSSEGNEFDRAYAQVKASKINYTEEEARKLAGQLALQSRTRQTSGYNIKSNKTTTSGSPYMDAGYNAGPVYDYDNG